MSIKSSEEHSDRSVLSGFEEQLRVLEALVGRMEAGDQTLEQAFEDYQKGVSLVKNCQEALHFAEQKVSVLAHKTNQAFQLKPYEGQEESDRTDQEE